MSSMRKVVWTQGMFLQPQHFQQQAREAEQRLEVRITALHPHAWGHAELVLDESQLALGRVALVRATGVLSDGTPYAIPQQDAVPPPLEVPADMKGEIVYLAVPVSRDGITEVDFGDVDADGAGPDHGRRDILEPFRYRAVIDELRDRTRAGDDPEPIQTAALTLRLLRERDATDGWARVGIVRVVERRSDAQIVLDRQYIPPQTRIDGSGQLSSSAALLHGLVQQRARLLASHMGQGGHGVSEMAQFLMLLTLNRAEPVLRQFAGAPSVHPWELHGALLQLAGELATYTGQQRHPPAYPLYRHEDLHTTYAALLDDLRRHLSAVIDRNAEQIDLVERSHGVRTAMVADAELLRSAAFVLAVNASVPAEQLRQHFPLQSKLGPVERIRDLVNLQLPGVAMRLLPVAPRQLPYHTGFHYFELDRSGDLWKQLERNGSLALHVAGDFPGLEIELWAVRQQ